MGTAGIESGGRLGGVKYVARGRTGGKLVPSISSNVTSSRLALLLSLLSLLMVLVLLGLGLSSLSPLPARVAEQNRVLELLQEEIDEQEQRLSQMEAREDEERAERRQEEAEEEMRRGKKARKGALGRVVEQGVQERLPGSTCSLPPDAGPCTTASLQRWHYHPGSSACHQFTFGGCEGNSNNFKTARECLAACGGTPDCLATPEAGPCAGRATRFFWDSVQEACETFEYGGCAGNTNNFMSLKQCNDQCLALKGTQLDGGWFKKEFGNDDIGIWSEVKEEGWSELSNAANTCNLSPDSGPCKGNHARWFNHPDNSSCHQFNWGGCGGNDNNFATKAKCLSRCGKDQLMKEAKDNVCHLPLDRGSCSGDFVRWGGSGGEDGCRAFLWGGCGGNQNNFASEEECTRACPD